MPSLDLFLLFLLADLVQKFSPGPDMAAVIARGIIQGRRAGVACALGVGATSIVQIPAAVFGLGAIFQASPLLFNVLKIGGALYLLWIGSKAIIRCIKGSARLESIQVESAAFQQGFFSNLLNPKVYIFLIAFIPQFVSIENGPIWSQTLILVTVMKFNGALFLAGLGCLAATGKNWLNTNRWFLRLQDGIFGSLMTLIAGYVAFSSSNVVVTR